jgi:heme-degrading monooxygenase HmoA
LCERKRRGQGEDTDGFSVVSLLKQRGKRKREGAISSVWERKERGPVGRSTRGSRPAVTHGARSGGGEWRYVEAITGQGVR